MTNEMNLLPCPFCGGAARIDANEGYKWWYVICDRCAAQTSECGVHSAEEAAARWNRREPKLSGVEFLQAWIRTPNPMLGDISPLDMLKMDKGDKLAQFIETAYELDKVPT